MKNMLWLAGRYSISLVVICCMLALFGGGCLLTSMLGGPESPRPKPFQVEAAKEIVNTNVPVVVGAQTNKQDNIQLVALKALEIIKETTTAAQAEAVTNVAANSFKAIKDSDGTKDIVGSMMEKNSSDVLTMSGLQYALYAAGQTTVAMRNQEAAYQGIKVGWQWTTKTIASVAGAATGTGGIIAFALSVYRKMRRKDNLLKNSGQTIKTFKIKNPKAGKKLTTMMAKEASKLPINAAGEFGI